jgi:hypothetical protein
MSDTTSTTLDISDGSEVGVGSILLVDSERMLVSDRGMLDTAVAQSGTGCTTASKADDILTMASSYTLNVGEVVQLDWEQMRVLAVQPGSSTIYKVERAWGGTLLATHSSAEVYVNRSLTVTRGALGTTAATHLDSADVYVYLIPGLVNELAVAEAINHLQSELSGYQRKVGSIDDMLGGGRDNMRAKPAPMDSLNDIRDRCYTALGRKMRRAVI